MNVGPDAMGAVPQNVATSAASNPVRHPALNVLLMCIPLHSAVSPAIGPKSATSAETASRATRPMGEAMAETSAIMAEPMGQPIVEMITMLASTQPTMTVPLMVSALNEVKTTIAVPVIVIEPMF